MNTGEAVREVMKSKNITITGLAYEMDKMPRLVSERLGQCPEAGFEIE